MGHITAMLFRQFREWERPAQIGLIIAAVLLVPVFIVAASGPQNLRLPATVGVIGLIISAQIIIMWANRGMVSDYTRAQRMALRGNFTAARDLLEQLRASGKADFRAVTLLGNTYRQLGDLTRSEAILYEALNIAPDHYFPLYGFGRTLLVQGRYDEAAQAIENALEHGAAELVRIDAAEAHYRQGNHEQAATLLQTIPSRASDEPQRELMVAYLRYRMALGAAPTADLIAAGLPFWETQAGLYEDTPYGQSLATDVKVLQSLA